MTEQAYRAKRELAALRDMNRRISEKYERIRALREAASRATPSLTAARVSGSGDRSRVESAMIRAIDLERQLDEAIDRLNERRFSIQNAIDRMEDPREQRLLELRYVDGRSWANVNARLEIGETWSRAVHQSALEHFAEKYFSSTAV